MKKEKRNNSNFMTIALIVMTIAYGINFFTTEKTIRNLRNYNTRCDEQFMELISLMDETRIKSFTNGYYKGVLCITEQGYYSKPRFKQDSIEFINILKQTK